MIGRTKNHNPIGPLSPEVAEHLAEAIDTIEFGIMLVAQDGFVTFANKMARQLMQRGEGLRANGGWIAATSAEVTARLRSFVKQSAAETDSERRGGATAQARDRDARGVCTARQSSRGVAGQMGTGGPGISLS